MFSSINALEIEARLYLDLHAFMKLGKAMASRL